ncbi:piggyBac transposable element-derived protein 3-like [Nilaparvata lugens]|uniref:piggyBac transposable element-derived protein 3-like n=1 Tax=Nilaparvata lugens TaxID=108931 RepID=UPI00193D2099|nr:piggyBac transposable element-derived protein 3-like [Nilaparvata lugens]
MASSSYIIKDIDKLTDDQILEELFGDSEQTELTFTIPADSDLDSSDEDESAQGGENQIFSKMKLRSKNVVQAEGEEDESHENIQELNPEPLSHRAGPSHQANPSHRAGPSCQPENIQEVDPQPGPSHQGDTLHQQPRPTRNTQRRTTNWEGKEFVPPDIQFTGETLLPEEIMQLETPYQFFSYFFNEELLVKICEQTLLYSVQKDPAHPFEIQPNLLKKYIGILIFMSIVKMNNVRNYWSKNIGHPLVMNVMGVNKFEEIKKNLHLNDNSTALPVTDPNHDRLHKIRPVIDHLRKKFDSVPKEENLSVDEQICATKVRHYMKQYNPMKPHKWGFKVFVLSGISGFAYNFEFYSGQENVVLPGEPDIGASANVVVRLARSVPRNKHFKIYFDNWYTNLPLLVYLEQEGIHSIGTIRRNRFPGISIPAEKDLKKEPRGTSHESVGSVDNINVVVVSWNDNKNVLLASTFVGEQPLGKCKRYVAAKKEKIEIPRPAIVQEYVKFMGGVDLLDSLIG